MNGLLAAMRGLGVGRLIGLGLAAVMTIAMLVMLTMVSGGEQMALLYGDLDLSESGQIVEQLDKQQIPYQLRGGGRQILVPAERVARARLALAREQLPSGGGVGYEIFDRADGLTATQFQQRINQLRALEGELARTIRAVDGVRAARVHIVLPRREPFEREPQQAQASVLLSTVPGGIDRDSVRAVVRLVATAVPGLKVGNITVADSRGDLLTRVDDGDGGQARSEELRRGIEARMSRGVEEILERSLGPGKVRAEANVELDLQKVSETHEQYDPDGQVVRSTQTSNANSRSTESTPPVTVQNNLPNADAGQNPAGSQEQKQDETTNYEITRTTRQMVRDQAEIRRVSVAVMVDGITEKGADGAPVWKPQPAEDLDRITRLVKSAVGFDAKRGDQVEVVSMRFAKAETLEMAPPLGMLGLGLGHDELMGWARTAIPAALVLAMLLFILRPMVMRLTAAAPAMELEGQGAATAALPALPGHAAVERLAGEAVAALPSPEDEDDPLLLEDETAEVTLGNVQGTVRANALRRLTALVEKHPEESISIVRGWLREEAV